MTITLILPQPPGYSETFFRSKIQGLQESGHEVILVTAATDQNFEACQHLHHPKVSKNNLVQVFKMLGVYLGLLPYLKSVSKYIKLEKSEGTSVKRMFEKLYINATLIKLRTDWLHFGFATMALERELVAKAIGAQLAVSLRGYDIGVYPLKHPNCYTKLWDYVDKVHSISKYLLEKAYGLGLSTQVPINIITPAVDLKMIGHSKPTHNDKLTILSIARLHWIKGIDDLIETAYALKQKGIDFEWKIIGSGDQKHEERYKFHVYQKQLRDQIIFLDKQTHQETIDHLHKTDIYVQTSLSEGFCNAVLEAQALGKLCLVYDAGALSENIVHEETSWLVQKAKPELLANKILEVLNHDEKIKKSIQGNAKERVQNKFGLEVQKEAFTEFYL
ncbi:glycosyltransferase family 4 protein [Psychroflexus tropicus]|uniref:glycosyltransferase family 4 protein n=1 Tax=Psychroflexus tropicus TaxID=197345 RepID=UPI00035D3F81|nr:glycosyltransferase family 4 protein [Psychroflexus tropicus]